MKKTNFKTELDSKTGKYNIIRFNSVYGSYTEQELHKKDFGMSEQQKQNMVGSNPIKLPKKGANYDKKI